MINYAILGLLSEKPMSGYDLKKVMQDSIYMYWSGNNNQIYKALLELCSEGHLTAETIHQEGAPSKKIYSITDKGRAALKDWICSTRPEIPEFKKPFLIQVAFTDQLEPAELKELLLKYRDELSVQLKMQMEKERRGDASHLTKRQEFIKHMLYENICGFYETELEWAQKMLKGINEIF
jgi:DNA-binding PadR family transcriptional regulator